MPYTIQTIGDRHCVVNENTGETVPGGCHDTPGEAQDHLAALAANVDKIRLTKRESIIAHYLIAGWSDKEIARSLIVSEATVRTHVNNILRKFGSYSRAEIALKMIVMGHITLRDLVCIYREAARFRPKIV